MRRPLAILALACACNGAPARSPAPAAPSRPSVIYLVATDRFFDGDRTNDGPPECFDPKDPTKLHGGDLAGVRSKIGYLEELGVSTVWILPVYAQTRERCGYHGYWADFADPDDQAIAPWLGTAADLDGLARDLHARRMGLVLDMVLNHTGRGARVVAEHPDWFHDPETCAGLGPREVFCPIGGKPLPDFAQEKPEVAAYLTRSSVGWAKRFAIDGIRMDTVKHVPIAYWKDWTRAIAAARPGLFTVGEVFDTGDPAHLAPYLDAGFTSLFNFPLYAAIVATIGKGGSLDALANEMNEELRALGASRLSAMTSFIDNHDVPRFVTIAGDARRQNLALGAIFTLPGIPQLYYGDEILLQGDKDPDNRRDMPRWAFSGAGRAAQPDAEATFALVQRLIRLRAEHPALREGAYVEMWRPNGGANVFAFGRSAGDDRLVVAINAGAEPARVTVRAELDRELLGTSAAVRDGAIELPPLTMGVYGTRRARP